MSLASHGTNFVEISQEERNSLKIRRKFQDSRMIRDSSGFLLPYSFAGLADQFFNFDFCNDDVVVSTFPKSGTVWMAEILWAMTHFNQTDTMDTSHINSRSFFLDLDFLHPANSEDKTPLMDKFRDMCPEGKIEDGLILQLAKAHKGRRIIKTHLQFKFFNDTLLNQSKIVYVARNPKDTCVSLYYFLSRRPDMIVEGDFATFVQSFMDAKMNFAPYWGHLEQAWNLRDHPNFHFVFYEDMKKDIMKELGKLNDFLHLKLTTDQLKKVSEATNFDIMRSRDMKNPLTNMVGSFFRKGVVGDWQNMATPELDAQMNCWIEENSKNIGIEFTYS